MKKRILVKDFDLFFTTERKGDSFSKKTHRGITEKQREDEDDDELEYKNGIARKGKRHDFLTTLNVE